MEFHKCSLKASRIGYAMCRNDDADVRCDVETKMLMCGDLDESGEGERVVTFGIFGGTAGCWLRAHPSA